MSNSEISYIMLYHYHICWNANNELDQMVLHIKLHDVILNWRKHLTKNIWDLSRSMKM